MSGEWEAVCDLKSVAFHETQENALHQVGATRPLLLAVLHDFEHDLQRKINE